MTRSTALLTVIPKSVPAAKAALALLAPDVDAAKTYEAIRRIERAADAIKLLFFEIEEIRHQTETVIELASHRVGTELKKAPDARGGDHKSKDQNSRPGRFDRPTLAQRVGSQARIAAGRAGPADHGGAAGQWRRGDRLGCAPVGARIHQGRSATQHERDLADKILALPDERFGVILADPNWNRAVYSTTTVMSRHAANHYAVAGENDEATQDNEIKALRVVLIAAVSEAPMYSLAAIMHDVTSFHTCVEQTSGSTDHLIGMM
jgi:hypothetical protein